MIFRQVQPRSRWSGFTIVELLVVISIIGVLVALLLPAIHAAREAARRISCTNNLKQLGLGLWGYHDTHGQFPPAGVDYGWCRFPERGGSQEIRNWNGLLFLLPHLEQQAVFDRFDQRHPASNVVTGNDACCAPTATRGTLIGDAVASGNGDVVSQHLSIFDCPSDIGDLALPDSPYYHAGPGVVGAKTNYDFSGSRVYECKAWKWEAENTKRLFGENTSYSDKDVTDGLSNTAAIIETLRDVYNGRCPAWGYRAWVMVGIDLGGMGINAYQLPAEVAHESRQSQLAFFASAGSLHEGGINLAMADGSVRFLDENTATSVLEALSAIADGGTVAIP